MIDVWSAVFIYSELPDWLIRTDGAVVWQATEKDRVDLTIGRGDREKGKVDYRHEYRFSSDEDVDGTSKSAKRKERKRRKEKEVQDAMLIEKEDFVDNGFVYCYTDFPKNKRDV